RLMEIVKRAPSILGESAAQLEDLAGLAPKRFDYWIRYGSRPSRASAIATLSAIIETANERLIDAERAHIGRWVDTPYTLDSARDLQQALTEIIEFVRTSNSLSQVPELEEENRRHLISLCRTVIGLLEGPKVELGLLEQCAKALKKIAPVVVSAAVSAAVGAAVTNLMRPVEHACSATDDAA
ncbi:MAG TPA: hypothetical protein PLS69_09495, partial [Terricaulis sp.]|nr:hypothetical protein [Terricaulis sp.]